MTNDIKKRILNAALEQWPNINVRAIGRAVDMSHSAVLYHFGDAYKLKCAIVDYAIERGESNIIVQLIARNHPAIQSMSPEDKQRHFEAVR